jgi:hypothetical protein
MPYTADQLAALEKSIASGLLEVRYADGRTVKYRSLAEMKQIRDDMKAALGTRTCRNNSTLAAHRRGF